MKTPYFRRRSFYFIFVKSTQVPIIRSQLSNHGLRIAIKRAERYRLVSIYSTEIRKILSKRVIDYLIKCAIIVSG